MLISFSIVDEVLPIDHGKATEFQVLCTETCTTKRFFHTFSCVSFHIEGVEEGGREVKGGVIVGGHGQRTDRKISIRDVHVRTLLWEKPTKIFCVCFLLFPLSVSPSSIPE